MCLSGEAKIPMMSGNLFLTLPETSQNAPHLPVRFVPASGSDRKLIENFLQGLFPTAVLCLILGVWPAGWEGDVTRGCAEAS